jgi:hypothetical protein
MYRSQCGWKLRKYGVVQVRLELLAVWYQPGATFLRRYRAKRYQLL